jgi:cytochrome b561
MPAWQQTVAHALHGLLYLLLLLLPMSGWLYSSASGFPVVYLGVVPLPDLVHKDRALAQVLREVHEAGGWLLFATVLLHAAAALKHHLVDHDDTLKRMLRWRR